MLTGTYYTRLKNLLQALFLFFYFLYFHLLLLRKLAAAKRQPVLILFIYLILKVINDRTFVLFAFPHIFGKEGLDDNRHFQALALNLAAIFIGLFNGAIHQVGVCVTAAATEEAGPAGPALLFLHNVHMAEVLNHIFFHNTHI